MSALVSRDSSVAFASDWEGRPASRWLASSIERRHRPARSIDDAWGRSESLDPENVGDIADEGAGHRG
jgi:hypothetical protein